jgi:hypothetical protein
MSKFNLPMDNNVLGCSVKMLVLYLFDIFVVVVFMFFLRKYAL